MNVRRHRWLVAGVLGGVFLSGAAHAVLHYYLQREGAFGPEPHPLEPWALKLHGLAAMATLGLLGALLGPHIARFWRLGRNRWAGGVLTVLAGWLAITGYALYYIGGDAAREGARLSHIWVGFGAGPVFAWHWWRGRRTVRRPPNHLGSSSDRL